MGEANRRFLGIGWNPAATGLDAERRRSIGRLAGILFSAGALASVPANQLLTDPSPPPYVHLIDALAFASGIVCFLVPWDRLSPRWFHLIPLVATAEVALAVWGIGVHGPTYAWFYVFVAVFVGYGFRDRRVIAAHLTFMSACFAAPILYLDENVREAVVQTVVSVPVLWVLAGVVIHLRENLEARQLELQDLAERDPLTGVGNYRRFYERLRYELSRHRRTGRRFAVIVLDMDGFKDVNDTFGHLVGDRLLRQVAEALEDTVRTQDTVSRQGGDEFSILAPETDAEQAEALIDRLRLALAGLVSSDGSLTASFGYAIYPDAATTLEGLLAHADDELRADKLSTNADRPVRPRVHGHRPQTPHLRAVTDLDDDSRQESGGRG